MGKKILVIMMFAVVAAFAGYNVYQSQKGEMISDLMLANVEALALDENSVTCVEDWGDTCVVGSTSVPNYDEKDNIWW